MQNRHMLACDFCLVCCPGMHMRCRRLCWLSLRVDAVSMCVGCKWRWGKFRATRGVAETRPEAERKTCRKTGDGVSWRTSCASKGGVLRGADAYPSSELPCDSSASIASYPSSSANDSWISSSVASIPSEDMSLLFLSSAAGTVSMGSWREIGATYSSLQPANSPVPRSPTTRSPLQSVTSSQECSQ